MSSTAQPVTPCPPAVPARRSIRTTRYLRWAVAVAGFAVLVTACGIPPYATHTITGTGTQGTVSDLGQDDNSHYTTGASCDGAVGGCTTDWYGAFNVGQAVSSELHILYVGKNAGAGWQFISVWNWRTSSWVPIDAFRVVATDEIAVDRTLPLPSSDWLTSTGVGFVRATTIGNLSSSSADVLLGCPGTAC